MTLATLAGTDNLDLPGYWQVVWFGAVRRALPDSSTTHIRTYLRPIALSAEGEPLYGQYASAQVAERELPIGELSEVPIGTVVHNGEFVEVSPFEAVPQVRYVEAKIHVGGEPKFFRRSAKDADGQLIMETPKVVGMPDIFEYQNALCMGFAHEGKANGVVLPSVESFRFFYCTSSNMANAFMDGWFFEPNEFIHDLSEFKLDYLAGEVNVALRRTMHIDDLHFIIPFLYGPGRQAAERLSQFQVAQGRSGTPFVRAEPPLFGPLTLRGWARRQTLPNGDVRIVFLQLESCDWEVPYNKIIYSHELKHLYEEKKKEAPSAPPAPPKGYGIESDTKPTVKTTNTKKNQAGKKAEPTRIKARNVSNRFPSISRKPVVAIVKDIVNRKTKTKKIPKRVEIGWGSTVTGGGYEGVPRALIGRHERDYEAVTLVEDNLLLSESMRRVVDALKEMQTLTGVMVAFKAVAHDLQRDNSDLVLNYFPLTRDNRIHYYYYLDPPLNTIRRRMLVAEINNWGRFRYVFETERRLARDGREVEDRNILVVWKLDQQPLPDSDLYAVLRACALRCGNPKSSAGFLWLRFGYVSHQWTKSDRGKRLMERIFDAPALPHIEPPVELTPDE